MTDAEPAVTMRFFPPRRWIMRALVLPVLLAASWAGGFAWFLLATGSTAAPPPHADAILALTGGAGRVEAALRLLAEGRADRLLVSGVGRAAEFPELAHRAGVGSALAPRVTLGRAALSTRGNAAEAADWVRQHGVRSLIVVTSFYHMPRALAELRQTLPEVTLHPSPVPPPLGRAVSEVVGLRLLASEYSKFLVAELGLSRLRAREEASDGRGQPEG
jgi:uncharacterized SAM-binding protein YcdF (DUF218 family)